MANLGLAGGRVRLVPSEASLHLENALAWFNDPAVTQFLHTRAGTTRRETEQFFERMATARDTDLHWAILDREFGHVGFIALHKIDWPTRSAVGGVVIGDPKAWGLGIATDAFLVRSRFAFDTLGLRRVEGKTINPAARRVYEKSGYRLEGVERQKMWGDGRWQDLYLYATMADDRDARPG